MGLTVEQIQDLTVATQSQLGRLKWTEIASDLQEHIALPKVLKKERVTYGSGDDIRFNVLYDHNNSARNVGLYGVKTVRVGDGLAQGVIPWRHTTADYSFDRRELEMNRSPSKIVDLLRTRRAMMMISMAERMEQNWWGKPADSTDEDTPFGIDYWVVSNASEGFNGADPAGFAAGAANLDVATYPRWKNWTATYAAISKTDLVRKWRKAMTFTKFKSAAKLPSYNTGDRYGMYTNYNVIGPLEEALEAQNDNLGTDIASMDGRLHFRRVPVTWVPYLEADATDPVYGINWGVCSTVFLRGEYFHEEKPYKAPHQPTVMVVDVDCTYNWRFIDRRRLFKLNK